jgi:hypothetical protein
MVVLLVPNAVYDLHASQEVRAAVMVAGRSGRLSLLAAHEFSFDIGPLEFQIVAVILSKLKLRCGAQMFCNLSSAEGDDRRSGKTTNLETPC